MMQQFLPAIAMLFLLALVGVAGCSLFGQDNEDVPWDTSIPESEAFDAGLAAWGPDGEQIVFTHTLDSAGASTGAYDQLWVANLVTGERRRVAPGRVFSPDWSPDGKWIVFFSGYPGVNYLYKIRVTGDSLVRLTGPGSANPKLEYTVGGEWSPSGDRILFTISAGEPRGTAVMHSDGSEAHILDDYSYDGTWFPRGERITYVDYVKINGDSVDSDLC